MKKEYKYCIINESRYEFIAPYYDEVMEILKNNPTNSDILVLIEEKKIKAFVDFDPERDFIVNT